MQRALSPKTRRVVQAILYEVFAVAFVGPALALIFDKPAVTALSLAVFLSVFALAWNYVFNSFFERWEAGQSQRGRSVLRRIAHASGFEGVSAAAVAPDESLWLGTARGVVHLQP
ncbi:MAG: PACE efflux transporter [Proteobacteria bacterium]|nr:PACE efflux transporter [Pseudomonadota bacterium]